MGDAATLVARSSCHHRVTSLQVWRNRWCGRDASALSMRMLKKPDVPSKILARRERVRRSRQRRKAGGRTWRLDLPDETTEVMIDDLVHAGRLTEVEALDARRVADELARQLMLLWSNHRSEIR
jgi:hypothetical protein